MPASMRNVELKARDPDPMRTLRLALALGAEDRGEIAQRDTYFAGARGRLKLREQEPGEDELIQYTRADAAEARTSTYRRVPTGSSEALRESLGSAYGQLVIVAKRRRLLLFENVRIHLDEVEGLGTFLELEAVSEGGSASDGDFDSVRELRSRLEIADENLIAASYSDLLLATPEALLRAAEEAMRNAYVPYSEFPVGAALRAPDGGVYAGANVENESYPEGQCAETSAIGRLHAAGAREIVAVAVTAERADLCPPCGGCRQRLAEFAKPDTPVYLGRVDGPRETTTIGELLPLAFELDPRG